jgi:hypothetical protein
VVEMVVAEGTVERKGEEREKNYRVNFYTSKTRGIGRMFLEIILNIYYLLFLKDYCKKLSIPKLFNKDM